MEVQHKNENQVEKWTVRYLIMEHLDGKVENKTRRRGRTDNRKKIKGGYLEIFQFHNFCMALGCLQLCQNTSLSCFSSVCR